MTSSQLWLIVFSIALLCGCTSLSTIPPEQFDLSGDWHLNSALSDYPALGSVNGAGGAKAGKGGNRGAGAQGRGGPRSGGSSAGRQGRGGANRQTTARRNSGRSGGRVNVGALESNSIEIEQNEDSMGMQFDRGVYRDVSWGERVRGNLKINTGWDERVLVIETKGDRMPVVERYSLSDDGQRLHVTIELNDGRGDMTFLRVFDRVTAAHSGQSRVPG